MAHGRFTGVATYRFLRAYTVALRILTGYWWFFVKARFFGSAWRDRKIEAVHTRAARRIERAILRLEGLFIKVGQMFSIMTNVLPAAFRDELKGLQDSVPAKSYASIARQVTAELGAPPEKVFASFDTESIASASLGQVHRAVTHEGEQVVVKVRHQYVAEMAEADLRTIWRILQLVKRFVPAKGLDNYYHEIRAMILEELDFSREAANIKRIAANFSQTDKVLFPQVYEAYSTAKVLTLNYLDGTKISETDILRQKGVDLTDVAHRLLTIYCQMVLVDGVYHADPHPGNIMVTDDGHIILLDFGAVGTLPSHMREGLGFFVEGIIKADENQVLQSLQTMGFLSVSATDSEAAIRVIEHFHRKFQQQIKMTDFNLSSIQIDPGKSFQHLSDIRNLNVGLRELTSAFYLPREWVLLERTTLQLTGICTCLDDRMNPMDIVRPYLEEFVLGDDRDWSAMVFDLTREKVLSLLSLPRLVERHINHMMSGRMKVRVDNLSQASQLVYLGIQQLSFALLCVASCGMWVYLDATARPDGARYAAMGAAGFVGLFLINVLRAGIKKK